MVGDAWQAATGHLHLTEGAPNAGLPLLEPSLPMGCPNVGVLVTQHTTQMDGGAAVCQEQGHGLISPMGSG